MQKADNWFDVPKPGITYALNAVDVPFEFKQLVMTFVMDSPWNHYVDGSLTSQTLRMAEVLGVSPANLRLTQGADGALRQLLDHPSTGAVLRPQNGYPGYSKWTQEIANKITYPDDASSGQIRAAAKAADVNCGTPLIICWPGNPIENSETVSDEGLRSLTEVFDVIIDATYLSVLSDEFADLVRAGQRHNLSVVFSFSKALGIPGARIGGIIGPEVRRPPISRLEKFPWDIFQLAVVEASLDPFGSELLRQRHHQISQLKLGIVVNLHAGGARTYAGSGNNFVTVKLDDDGNSVCGVDGFVGKIYRDLNVIRLDSCAENLELSASIAG